MGRAVFLAGHGSISTNGVHCRTTNVQGSQSRSGHNEAVIAQLCPVLESQPLVSQHRVLVICLSIFGDTVRFDCGPCVRHKSTHW